MRRQPRELAAHVLADGDGDVVRERGAHERRHALGQRQVGAVDGGHERPPRDARDHAGRQPVAVHDVGAARVPCGGDRERCPERRQQREPAAIDREVVDHARAVGQQLQPARRVVEEVRPHAVLQAALRALGMRCENVDLVAGRDQPRGQPVHERAVRHTGRRRIARGQHQNPQGACARHRSVRCQRCPRSCGVARSRDARSTSWIRRSSDATCGRLRPRYRTSAPWAASSAPVRGCWRSARSTSGSIAVALYTGLAVKDEVDRPQVLWGLVWRAEAEWLPFVSLVLLLVFARAGLYRRGAEHGNTGPPARTRRRSRATNGGQPALGAPERPARLPGRAM